MRRVGGTLLCLLAMGCPLLAAPPTAPAAGSESAVAALVQRSVLTAIAATQVGQALRGLEGSLVYLDSKYGTPERVSVAPPAAAPAAEPEPSAPALEDGEIPPASAGSNGTPIPPPPPGMEGGGDLSAHAPVLHGAQVEGMSATFVSGIVLAPAGVPERVKGVINAANTIVGRPYAWGGGHGSWYASGYDCSGAVSFALAGGGMLSSPLASGQFAGWGAPGPGRWITVYASPSHAYAVIAGFRWDTVGDANGSGPRWHRAGVPPDGFVARHPPGY